MTPAPKVKTTLPPTPITPKNQAPATKPPHVLNRWLTSTKSTVGKHPLQLMAEQAGARANVIDELRELVRSHYVSPDVTAKRLADLGAPKTAELLREHIPTRKRARSGDLGEILATEVAEQTLSFTVPIRRLRWKDGREMALRGDDIIGIRAAGSGTLQLLKGESKSRAALSSDALDEAGGALDSDGGRPTRHAVLFIAERLREMNDDALALSLENAVLSSFSGCPIDHLLFVLTAGNPKNLLTVHLTSAATKPQTLHAVGVQIADHGAFIGLLFGGI